MLDAFGDSHGGRGGGGNWAFGVEMAGLLRSGFGWGPCTDFDVGAWPDYVSCFASEEQLPIRSIAVPFS